MERMVGPADFTMNDESGILIEGFELRPMIRQPWHPPYYQQLVERAGMTKAMDLLMWNLEVTDRDKVLPVIWELADEGSRPSTASACARCAAASCAKTWTPSPRSTTRRGRELGLRALLQEGPRRLRPGAAARLRQALVHDRRARRHRRGRGHGDHGPRPQPGAREDERPAAAVRLVALPATRASIIDRVRVGFLGVKPEYQHTGVAARSTPSTSTPPKRARRTAARWAGSSRPTRR